MKSELFPRARGVLTTILVLSALACGQAGCSSDPCDPDELSEALADAESGDTVEVGACEVHGRFVVPAGVTLRGAGVGRSVIVGEGARGAIELASGGSAAVVGDLSVRSDGAVGIVAHDGAVVRLERVNVEISVGVGVGLDGASQADLTSVHVVGPGGYADVTSADAKTAATHGLVMVGVGNANATDVTATGFATAGVLLVGTKATWSGGGAPDNATLGLGVYGGSVDLTGLDLSRTVGGASLVAGGIFAGGANVTTHGLIVHDSGGQGLVHDDVTVRHDDLEATGSKEVAVWVQHATSFELGGASVLTASRYAGLFAFDSANVVIDGATIDRTELAVHVVGETGSTKVGDGIQIVGASKLVRIANVTLSENARVGLLVDRAGATGELEVENVSVKGATGQAGALLQDGSAAPTLLPDVTRDAATEATDASVVDVGSPFGILGPNTIPGLDVAAAKGILGPNT